MTSEQFWAIIDGAERDSKKLCAALQRLSRGNLLELYREFVALAHELRQPPYAHDNSDHEQELAWYVVGQGKAAYEAVLAHPETMPDEIGDDDARDFYGDIAAVYAERFGEEVMEADLREPIYSDMTLHPEFWSTIDAAQRDEKRLRALIEPMSRDELLAFYRDFIREAAELRKPPFDDEESDGNQERSWWVVAQGRATYDDILAHPEKMPDDTSGPGIGFRGMIARVFAEQFGMEVMEADLREP